jgi:Spy/CpxP family protein refolding chaperone
VGIVAGMIALAATPALAQGQAQGQGQDHERNHAQGARHGHDPAKVIERLRESLDLTDSQVAEVRIIFTEEAEKRRDLRESEDREGLRVLRQETHDRLVAVLDENQKQKLEGLKENRGEGHRGRDGEGGHPERHGAES